MKKKTSTADWVKFILIMLIFMIGMVAMLIYKISNPIIWIIFFTLWTLIELRIIKNIHLKWWVWGLIILGLSVMDYFVIQWVK